MVIHASMSYRTVDAWVDYCGVIIPYTWLFTHMQMDDQNGQFQDMNALAGKIQHVGDIQRADTWSA